MCRLKILIITAIAVSVAAAPRATPEAHTLSGDPLFPPVFTGEMNESLALQLSIARNNLALDACGVAAADPAKAIWLARRLGYQWRYQEALEVLLPLSKRTDLSATYAAATGRHLGHRLITVRNFTQSANVLGAAASLVLNNVPNPNAWEEDGEPNAANIPLSTLAFNTHYHHQLAHYLRGDFNAALKANTDCLAASHINDESMVATVYWRWMVLTRLGRHAEATAALAPMHPGMRELEGAAYLNMTLLFKGVLTINDVLPDWRSASPLDLATLGYGVGFYFVYGPRRNVSEGVALWRATTNGTYWASFGFIAAEAELYRLDSAHAAKVTSRATHSYTRVAGEKPLASTGAIEVDEGIRAVADCFEKCDMFTSNSSSKGACAGFTLLNANGVFLCAYYHSAASVGPPNPPERDLVAWYAQGSVGPAPAPGPPLPPPPPAPTPAPVPPRAPDHFLCTLHTDVGSRRKGETIVLNISRASAPHGVDHFHLLAKIGFFNEAAFYRYAPNFLVEWGVSANSTLNHIFGHSPIPDDPVVLSNVAGTVSFADGGMGRATVLFLNFDDNSRLDKNGIAPFATVVDDGHSMKTARAIFNPTPNSTSGIPPQAYADNGDAWIRRTYPGINFIKSVTLSE